MFFFCHCARHVRQSDNQFFKHPDPSAASIRGTCRYISRVIVFQKFFFFWGGA